MATPVRVSMTVNGVQQDRRGRASGAARPLPARRSRADGHARRLRHHQLRRLHDASRRRRGEVLHRPRGPGRRREVTTIEGLARRRAAPGAGGLQGAPRPAVRLLHARHDDGRRRPARREPRPERGRGPRRRSRATSAAARATTTSSRPCCTRLPRVVRGDRRRGAPGRFGRPAAPTQGGRPADHRPGPLRRRHGRPGHALHGRRAVAGGAREDHLDRYGGGARGARASTPSSPARTSTSRPPLPMAWVRRASRSTRPSTGRSPRTR